MRRASRAASSSATEEGTRRSRGPESVPARPFPTSGSKDKKKPGAPTHPATASSSMSADMPREASVVRSNCAACPCEDAMATSPKIKFAKIFERKSYRSSRPDQISTFTLTWSSPNVSRLHHSRQVQTPGSAASDPRASPPPCRCPWAYFLLSRSCCASDWTSASVASFACCSRLCGRRGPRSCGLADSKSSSVVFPRFFQKVRKRGQVDM